MDLIIAIIMGSIELILTSKLHFGWKLLFVSLTFLVTILITFGLFLLVWDQRSIILTIIFGAINLFLVYIWIRFLYAMISSRKLPQPDEKADSDLPTSDPDLSDGLDWSGIAVLIVILVSICIWEALWGFSVKGIIIATFMYIVVLCLGIYFVYRKYFKKRK